MCSHWSHLPCCVYISMVGLLCAATLVGVVTAPWPPAHGISATWSHQTGRERLASRSVTRARSACYPPTRSLPSAASAPTWRCRQSAALELALQFANVPQSAVRVAHAWTQQSALIVLAPPQPVVLAPSALNGSAQPLSDDLSRQAKAVLAAKRSSARIERTVEHAAALLPHRLHLPRAASDGTRVAGACVWHPVCWLGAAPAAERLMLPELFALSLQQPPQPPASPLPLLIAIAARAGPSPSRWASVDVRSAPGPQKRKRRRKQASC